MVLRGELGPSSCVSICVVNSVAMKAYPLCKMSVLGDCDHNFICKVDA